MKNIKHLLLNILIVCSLLACDKTPDTPQVITPVVKQDYKVLFVGNSYTYYNDGVDFHLQNMLNADASSDSIKYLIQRIAVGSYTLEAHFGDPVTISKISSKNWKTVILQEQSTRPINNPNLFLEYAAKLDAEIKKINANTVLFMTWAPQYQQDDIDSIASTYFSAGLYLNAKVAEVGRVWEYFQNNNPNISLYISDSKHPTLSGTYVTACVFFYSLFGKNPVENIYFPSGMSAENAIEIRSSVYEFMKTGK
jgi:hypothetical protein